MVSEMDSVNKISTTNSVNNDSTTVYEMDNHQSVPSAQDIGLEFVRQYYTVLNRAPQLLFRFYSDDSTYVHGYLDKDGQVVEYIKGQKQINAKIMSLNYGKCHTKIRQVDSMETNGNGVVIQVIGELSTNEQPSRRFLQTFVLTPQTPNKYYVRNDIFRYLDKYQDDDTCDDTCSKVENISQEDVSQVDSASNVEKEVVYKTNGIGINDEFETVSKKIDPPAEPIEDTESVQKVAIETSNDSELKDDEEESAADDDTFEDISKGSVFQSSNEPKTYAGILGRSQGSNVNNSKMLINSPEGNSTSSYMNESNANSNAAPTVVVKPIFTASAPAASAPSATQPPARNEPYRFQKKTYNRRNDSKESAKNNDSDSGDGDHYRDKKYPDENQLFIGNLLPGFTDDIVHKIFGKFGKILDIRINRQKIPGNKSRNYGFITFEDPEVVNKIIAQKPIFHENHRYNVEKKQGKSNYERNRNSNMPLSTTTSVSGGSTRSVGGNASTGGGGQGSSSSNTGGSRNRGGGGPNYNHSSNNGNNSSRGPISNRNTFNQQQHNR